MEHLITWIRRKLIINITWSSLTQNYKNVCRNKTYTHLNKRHKKLFV